MPRGAEVILTRHTGHGSSEGRGAIPSRRQGVLLIYYSLSLRCCAVGAIRIIYYPYPFLAPPFDPFLYKMFINFILINI